MTQKRYYVGIDLGGTAIKLAIVSPEGSMLSKLEEPTDVKSGGDAILHQMNQMVDQALHAIEVERNQLAGVGIGAPAFLDTKEGFVHRAINLGWKNYPLKQKLQEITQLPVIVDNDANTAALGEMWMGAGQGARELLCITLGTGVGGGVIVHGGMYHGASGTSGEIGHVTVMPENGFHCNCGKSGCLETVASATGIVRLAYHALQQNPKVDCYLSQTLTQKGSLEAKDVAEAAVQGDELALGVVEKVGYYLGLALGNYTVVMNPEKIVIGGGVSKAGELLMQPIRRNFQRFALPELTGAIDIVLATLGNDAGVIGSAWLVHQQNAQ